MKARLGELQARLDSHEKRRSSSNSTTGSADMGNFAGAGHLLGRHGASAAMAQTPIPSIELDAQLPLLHNNLDGSAPASFPHQAPAAVHLMNTSPRSSQASTPRDIGLLSPPSPAGRPCKINSDLVMDCMFLLFIWNVLRLTMIDQIPACPLATPIPTVYPVRFSLIFTRSSGIINELTWRNSPGQLDPASRSRQRQRHQLVRADERSADGHGLRAAWRRVEACQPCAHHALRLSSPSIALR